MSDQRRFRKDARTRHDGKVSRSLSGPVRVLTPEEVISMEAGKPTPARINVTAEDAAKKAALREPPERSLADLQRAGLKVLNRELAFVEEASNQALAGNGTMSDEQFERFAKLMAIVKQHLIEERNQPPLEPSTMTEEQLQAEIEKRSKQ